MGRSWKYDVDSQCLGIPILLGLTLSLPHVSPIRKRWSKCENSIKRITNTTPIATSAIRNGQNWHWRMYLAVALLLLLLWKRGAFNRWCFYDTLRIVSMKRWESAICAVALRLQIIEAIFIIIRSIVREAGSLTDRGIDHWASVLSILSSLENTTMLR